MKQCNICRIMGNAEPCGAGALAAPRRFAAGVPEPAWLSRDSAIVVLSAEGTSEYPVPKNDN